MCLWILTLEQVIITAQNLDYAKALDQSYIPISGKSFKAKNKPTVRAPDKCELRPSIRGFSPKSGFFIWLFPTKSYSCRYRRLLPCSFLRRLTRKSPNDPYPLEHPHKRATLRDELRSLEPHRGCGRRRRAAVRPQRGEHGSQSVGWVVRRI